MQSADCLTSADRFESFGYTSEELQFDWVPNGSQVLYCTLNRKVLYCLQINPNISLAQFDVDPELVAGPLTA